MSAVPDPVLHVDVGPCQDELPGDVLVARETRQEQRTSSILSTYEMMTRHIINMAGTLTLHNGLN